MPAANQPISSFIDVEEKNGGRSGIRTHTLSHRGLSSACLPVTPSGPGVINWCAGMDLNHQSCFSTGFTVRPATSYGLPTHIFLSLTPSNLLCNGGPCEDRTRFMRLKASYPAIRRRGQMIMVGEPGFEPGKYTGLKPAAYTVLPLPSNYKIPA